MIDMFSRLPTISLSDHKIKNDKRKVKEKEKKRGFFLLMLANGHVCDSNSSFISVPKGILIDVKKNLYSAENHLLLCEINIKQGVDDGKIL
jgi:hypothetical protein